MVFSFEITGRMLQNPSNKRYPESGNLEKVWGTLNFAGVTTGDVILQCDNVLFCNVTIAEGARTPQVVYDTPDAGTVRLSGVTASDTGRFEALVKHV